MTCIRKTQRAAERIPVISSPPLFNNQRFRNAAIHMEIAQHANYPFARQTTKGLIQSTDKFAHSKNAGCLSQSRRKLQQRMVASAMAICYSQSDRFRQHSSRTMTGRGRSRKRRSRTKPRGRARPRRSHLPAVRAVSEICEGVVERAKIALLGS